MLISHDEDAHSFVNCPPNRSMAAIMSCFGDLMFSEKRGECVAEKDSDCQRKIESKTLTLLKVVVVVVVMVEVVVFSLCLSLPFSCVKILSSHSGHEHTKGDMRVCPLGLSPDNIHGECYPDEPLPPVVCRPRYLYHAEKADWESARVMCETEGGQLAVITNTAAQGRIETK